MFQPVSDPQLFKARDAVVRVVESFCQSRPRPAVLPGGALPGLGPPDCCPSPDLPNLQKRGLLLQYPVALYLQDYQPQDVAQFSELRMEVYILGPPLDGGPVPLEALWDLGGDAGGVGVSLPLGDLEAARERIRQWLDLLRAQGGRNFFWTGSEPPSQGVPPRGEPSVGPGDCSGAVWR